jgi:hypothetical protein
MLHIGRGIHAEIMKIPAAVKNCGGY